MAGPPITRQFHLVPTTAQTRWEGCEASILGNGKDFFAIIRCVDQTGDKAILNVVDSIVLKVMAAHQPCSAVGWLLLEEIPRLFEQRRIVVITEQGALSVLSLASRRAGARQYLFLPRIDCC